MYLAPGHPSSAPIPTSVATPDTRANSPTRHILHGSSAPTRDPGLMTAGTGRSRSPATNRRHDPPARRPGCKGSGRGRISTRVRNPYAAGDIGGQRQCFTWWTGMTLPPSPWELHDPTLPPTGHLPISRAPTATSLSADSMRTRPSPTTSARTQMTVTICLTCGQPILQQTNHPQIPGTQILPTGTRHHDLAASIGWRYLQTALRYTAHGQHDRARQLLNRSGHHL